MSGKMFYIALILLQISTLGSKAQDTDTIKAGQVIFFDDFSKDALGKFPANWTSNRPGEVVSYKSMKWLKMHTEGTYLPELSQEFPKNFTIEFDFMHKAMGNGNTTTELTLFGKTKSSLNDALFPGNTGIKIILETFIVSALCYDNQDTIFRPSGEFRAKLIQENNKARITIKVNDIGLRVFVNGFECLQIPQCWKQRQILNAARFYLWGSQAEPMISNLKIY